MSTSEVALARSDAAFAHAVAIDQKQRPLLLQYVSLADRAAREVGVTLRLRHDFAALAEIQEANRRQLAVRQSDLRSGCKRPR